MILAAFSTPVSTAQLESLALLFLAWQLLTPFCSQLYISKSIPLCRTGPEVKYHSVEKPTWVCSTKQESWMSGLDNFFPELTHTYLSSGRTFKAPFPKMYDKFWKYSTQVFLPTPYLQRVIPAATPNTTWSPHLNTVFWKISPKICPKWNASCKGNRFQHKKHHWIEETLKKVLKLQRKNIFQAQGVGNTYISSHLRFACSSKAKNASKWF